MCITVELILRAHEPTQTHMYGQYFKYGPIFAYLHLLIYVDELLTSGWWTPRDVPE